MKHTNPILEEKYRVQKILSEQAKDSYDYSRRAEESVRNYYSEHNIQLNVTTPQKRRLEAKLVES